MKKNRKLILGALLVVLVCAAAYAAWYLTRFVFYNQYQKYLNDYDVESGVTFRPIAEEKTDVEGMELAAESGQLKLYADVKTGCVAIFDKRNQATVYSNPVDLESDSIANKTNKNYMRSQMLVDYYNTARLESTFDSFSFCTDLGQLEAQTIEGGIRFLYTIGDMTSETGIVPQYISEETLNDVMSKLEEGDASFVRKKYTGSDVAEGYLQLLDSAVKGASQLRKLNKYFTEAGFTQEDYEKEMLGSGVEGAVPIYFVIPLEYRLADDAVEVSIPMKEVEEGGGGAIHRIQLLRYFGAGGLDEEGEMLVPNGSGSIIRFNNGKGSFIAGNDYSEYIYGIDPLAADFTVREVTDSVKMALFGIFREKSGIFATIERGAPLAMVTANVSGEVNEYNYVYPTFVLRGDDKLAMFGSTGSEAELPIVETHFYDENLTVRYTMLEEENSGYAGAANYYRDRLVREGALDAKTENGDIKFFYDVLGGVERTKYFLGTQYRGLYAMTSFAKAEEIAMTLKQEGISRQVMNYQGWTAGGYYMDVLNKIKVPRRLGGKSGLEALSGTLASLGGTFYADAAFQKVSEVSSRYSVGNETSRYYGTGYVAEFGLVDPTTLRQTSGLGYRENIYYLVSPKFLPRYVGAFADRLDKYDISGVALRDLGNELHSDKKRTNVIDRNQALDIVKGQLEILRKTGKKLLVDAGNDYSFAYADDMVNVPLDDNSYYVIDAAVPFYEMLLHGSVDYAGKAINLGDTSDTQDIILNLIENGASPHFLFSWENSNELKETGINRYYSTTFSLWKDEAVEIYQAVNEALKDVSACFIVDHEVDESGVSVTTYSDGTVIYVNRTGEDAKVGGMSVPAHSYRTGGAADVSGTRGGAAGRVSPQDRETAGG